MSRVQQLRQTPNSPLRPQASKSKGAPIQKINRRLRGDSEQHDENSSLLSSQAADDPTRAISTPTAADLWDNITFAGEANLTLGPPSPIPSMASAQRRGPGQLCLSPTVSVKRRGDRAIISMPHPDAADPKPVQWNIQSPRRQTSPESSTAAADGATPTRRQYNKSRAGMRRSTRAK